MIAYIRSSEVLESHPAPLPNNNPTQQLWLQLMVGPAGHPGDEPAESFDVRVCTPQWLNHQVTTHGPLVGLHHLVMDPLDLDNAITFLRDRTRRANRESWEELACWLTRVGRRGRTPSQCQSSCNARQHSAPTGGSHINPLPPVRARLHSACVINGEDPTSGEAWVRLMIGSTDGPGEESFDVRVCTPQWLSRQVTAHGPLIARHHLVVETMDLDAATAFLAQHVATVTGETWEAVGEELAGLGYWEFEDHQPP